MAGHHQFREKDGLLASFGKRMGRGLSDSLQKIYDNQIKISAVTNDQVLSKNITSQTLFNDNRPIWLEIGFGGGEHIAGKALMYPDVGFIGCEPYIEGVAKLTEHLDSRNINNIRIWQDDARLLIDAMPDNSVQKVFILFPDPWPKTRHHKRRIVSPKTLDMLARIIPKGGELLLATDHVDYAEWMLEHMSNEARFEWTAENQVDWETPPNDWIVTRYQEKAQRQGRTAQFFHYIKL